MSANKNENIDMSEEDFDDMMDELDDFDAEEIFAEDDAEEIMDDVDESEIKDNLNVNENVFEFRRNQKVMTCTISQRRFITKVKKIAQKHPDEVKIVAENDDGSIVVKMPVRALHIWLPKKRVYTEEQQKAKSEQMAKARAQSSRFQRGNKGAKS